MSKLRLNVLIFLNILYFEFQGSVYPGLISLIGKWIPVGERSKVTTIVGTGNHYIVIIIMIMIIIWWCEGYCQRQWML